MGKWRGTKTRYLLRFRTVSFVKGPRYQWNGYCNFWGCSQYWSNHGTVFKILKKKLVLSQFKLIMLHIITNLTSIFFRRNGWLWNEWSKHNNILDPQWPHYGIFICQYHSEEFPNMQKLAGLALCHPIHTADCERSFSPQNLITTKLRCRLSGEHVDELMRVMIEGTLIQSLILIGL